LYYLAFEPFVRRLWPETLISWSRLLAGRFRDPRVGRDLLLGALYGVVATLLVQLNVLAPGRLGLPASLRSPSGFDWLPTLLGGRYMAGMALAMSVWAIRFAMAYLVLLLLMRVALRKPWLAGGAFVALVGLIWSFGYGHPYLSWLFMGLLTVTAVFVLTYLGLLAQTVGLFVSFLLEWHLTPELSAWHAGPGLFVMGAVTAVAGYGFRTSLGQQPPFGRGWLGEG
jgi:hypothetical protein